MVQRCRLGEHDVEDEKFISQTNSCIDCYNLTQVKLSGFAHKLNPVDHQRLVASGYFYDRSVGYVKI